MLKTAGKSVSTWEIMDKIKTAAKPDEIIGMKVLKSTLQYVRFEAHLDSRHQISGVLQRLDRGTLKLNSFPEPLKMRACESKLIYPSRHDWDTFFQQNKNLNELKPGERPDTVHISLLPCHWFMVPQSSGLEANSTKPKPSEAMLRALFEVFGPLRTVDIPMLDPYRAKMIPNAPNTFAFGQDGLFEAFVQYQEYVGFLKCMTAFRGMKLLYREGNRAWTALVQVDFDRTCHQSERSLKLRRIARERLIQEEIDNERADKVRRELEQLKHEESRRQQTEERLKEEEESARKRKAEEEARVVFEERKLVLVQRRLESLRLLDAIFERVKAVIEEKDNRKKDPSKKKDKTTKKDKETRRQMKLQEKERNLRAKLLKKYQQVGQEQLEEQRERVRHMLQTSDIKLKSTVNVMSESKSLDKVSAAQVQTNEQSPPPLHEPERTNNGHTFRHDPMVNRPKPVGYRSSPVESNDRRKNDYEHNPHANQNHRHSSFNRKRYQSTESARVPTHQNLNRGGWKRNRFDNGKSNWASPLDQELWDGPNVGNQRQNPRGGYRRGGRSGGEHRMRRPPTAERHFMKSENRYATTPVGVSMSGESTMESALVERLT
ncbi:hypothetical protein GHT06_015483 [Daphnia sinensis]|uniref:A-kinase anchor protein 17A n=1 Tax=Daphnia sinensis TaxID=1820382 RepID=A0AAD5KR37_9CRUS|nr:hypothetical protein GHT06_015483 [Daphnia sinensis]